MIWTKGGKHLESDISSSPYQRLLAFISGYLLWCPWTVTDFGNIVGRGRGLVVLHKSDRRSSSVRRPSKAVDRHPWRGGTVRRPTLPVAGPWFGGSVTPAVLASRRPVSTGLEARRT